ncbi:MAG TPA: cytochrome c family protein [Candidimonas sp.]|nr:cytochrome c family protein [Candidimonas sp.]
MKAAAWRNWLAAAAVYGYCAAAPAQPAAAVQGNAAQGEAVYSRCLACHALPYDRTGPRHCGLFGRQAGTVRGFPYSDAMKSSRIIWDESTLNVFLRDPMGVVPGTAMGYAGIPDDQERADVIAWLKRENAGPQCNGK